MAQLTSHQANRQPYVNTEHSDSVEGSALRSGGRSVQAEITLGANNASESINVFQITGPIEGQALHAVVTDATTLTNCTGCYFDLWDGTSSVVLTKMTGAALSGEAVGTVMIKSSTASSALQVVSNAAGTLYESSGGKLFQHFSVVQKDSTNTYIRFNYTTTDTPINAKIEVGMHYGLLDGGSVAVV